MAELLALFSPHWWNGKTSSVGSDSYFLPNLKIIFLIKNVLNHSIISFSAHNQIFTVVVHSLYASCNSQMYFLRRWWRPNKEPTDRHSLMKTKHQKSVRAGYELFYTKKVLVSSSAFRGCQSNPVRELNIRHNIRIQQSLDSDSWIWRLIFSLCWMIFQNAPVQPRDRNLFSDGSTRVGE